MWNSGDYRNQAEALLVLGYLAPAYNPDAVALFARMSVQPNAARKKLISDTITSLQSAGLWAKLEILYFFAAADAQSARLNWISSNFNASTVNSPTFTSDRGYASDGSTSYLKTGFIPSSSTLFLQNSASMCSYDNTGGLINANSMGCQNVSAIGAFVRPWATSNLAAGKVNNAATATYGATAANSLGLTSLSRTASNLTTAYRNGVSTGTNSVVSAAPPATEVYLCTLNNNGGLSGFYTGRLAMVSIGASLNSTEVATLNTIVNTYLTAVGGN